jgi:chromosome partitioning protein
MRLIAVMNQKGGVGKTTTTLNIAHALAMEEKKVLALDMDPQAQLAAGFGLADGQVGLDKVLLDRIPIHEVIVSARERVLLAPAGPRLAEFEYLTENGADRGWMLQRALIPIKGHDFVLIDSPPSAGLLTMNVFLAASEVLIPVSGDYFALHGVSRFMQIMEHINGSLDRKTRVWLVLTRFNQRKRLARDVRDKLVEYFPKNVLITAVRECITLAESPSFGKTIFEYAERSHGARDYRALAQDLILERTV